VLNLVMREVAEANSQVQARKRQIAVAESGVKAAQASYKLNLERIRGVQGLPLEVLQSIQALDQARREYLRAVTDYNRAQFHLFRAMGWPVNPMMGAEVPPDCLITPLPVKTPSAALPAPASSVSLGH
jgi:outer membrane protein TolC